jgi:opacity protein-like surface antigen
MKKLLLTTTALVAFAAVGSAGAADLPVKAPQVAPIMAPAWTGFYVGGALGGEMGGYHLDNNEHFRPPWHDRRRLLAKRLSSIGVPRRSVRGLQLANHPLGGRS